jgi:pimeloyl-ACP methyl ester carboxylesterase
MLTVGVPVLGPSVMRLRVYAIMHAVFRGGTTTLKSTPARILRDIYAAGNGPGRYGAFLSLLRSVKSWEAASASYSAIRVPVLLVWGERDWSRAAEREQIARRIPGVEVVTTADGGHLLSLNHPDEVARLVARFARDAVRTRALTSAPSQTAASLATIAPAAR